MQFLMVDTKNLKVSLLKYSSFTQPKGSPNFHVIIFVLLSKYVPKWGHVPIDRHENGTEVVVSIIPLHLLLTHPLNSENDVA